MEKLKQFKSPWYYWYADDKKIAVIALSLSFLLCFVFLYVICGFSITLVALSIFLDFVGVFLLTLYFFLLQWLIPDFLGLSDYFQSKAWGYFLINVLPFLLLSVLTSRLVTFYVNKYIKSKT